MHPRGKGLVAGQSFNKMNIDEFTIKSWEEHAFYEAGLSADGCIDKLGEYEITAIEKYGRVLLECQEKYLKNADLRKDFPFIL
jgi:hypothetical protein